MDFDAPAPGARPAPRRPGAVSAPRPRQASVPASLAVRVAAMGLLVTVTWPRPVAAQACCASTGLVVPARLRVYEDVGVGVQARARQTYGSFASNGSFGTVSTGDLVTEQDLFAMGRVVPRLQLGVLVPFVETYRRVQSQSEWGGFLGDAAVNARIEAIRPGDLDRFPAVTLLAAGSVPTGRAPDDAHNLLGTDAAGSGSYTGTLGLEVEKAWTRWFASLETHVTWRSSRAAPGGRQSFAPRFGAVGAVGHVFASEVVAAVFSSAVREGGGAVAGSGPAPGPASPGSTGVGLVTAGVAGMVPIGEGWRIQAALAIDVPLAGWGQNMPATVGIDTSLVRALP